MGTTLTFLPGVAIDRQDLTTDKTMDCIKSLSQGPRGGTVKSMTWDKKKHKSTAFREQLL